MINSQNPLRVRGYSSHQQKWIYGFGATDVQFNERYAQETGIKEKMYVYTDYGPVEVDPETVGQCLGSNIEVDGLELYEGDIISVAYFVSFYLSATHHRQVTVESLEDIPCGPHVKDITLIGNIVKGVTIPQEDDE